MIAIRIVSASVRLFVGAAILLIVGTAMVGARALMGPGAINPTVAALSADALTSQAAEQLEAAIGKGGSGIAFDIVQTSTMHAKPGGPLIQIPDPTNARVIIGQSDTYPAYILLERGVVRPDGFWSEIRAWPIDAGPPEWEKAELRRSALIRDGVGWRNDRQGWYQAEVLPGIGLDPDTAALLPTLLRDSAAPEKQVSEVLDGAPVLRVDATPDKADVPGVVAAGGASFTRLQGDAEFAFDGSGRVVQIRLMALNTNLVEFDLVVETVITIRYSGVDALPEPNPTWNPASNDEEPGR